jgi:hypothetical protein
MEGKQDNGTVFYMGMQNNGGLIKGTNITAAAVVVTKGGKMTDRSAAITMSKGTSKTASVSIDKQKGQPTKLKAHFTF